MLKLGLMSVGNPPAFSRCFWTLLNMPGAWLRLISSEIALALTSPASNCSRKKLSVQLAPLCGCTQASSMLTLRMPALASSTAAAGKPPCTARADPDPSFRGHKSGVPGGVQKALQGCTRPVHNGLNARPATYGLQDQSQQTVSDTAQQTLQMVVFAPQWPPEAAMQPYR
ncbi:MAG: hypothetical protein FRX49_13557 [Trebouxia sp. A1-2]|nr:MAG: hypothetical protein FRX49_13557 [Trebouxia sp. A1-2]